MDLCDIQKIKWNYGSPKLHCWISIIRIIDIQKYGINSKMAPNVLWISRNQIMDIHNAPINVFPARWDGGHTRGIRQQKNPDRQELEEKLFPTGGK